MCLTWCPRFDWRPIVTVRDGGSLIVELAWCSTAAGKRPRRMVALRCGPRPPCQSPSAQISPATRSRWRGDCLGPPGLAMTTPARSAGDAAEANETGWPASIEPARLRSRSGHANSVGLQPAACRAGRSLGASASAYALSEATPIPPGCPAGAAAPGTKRAGARTTTRRRRPPSAG